MKQAMFKFEACPEEVNKDAGTTEFYTMIGRSDTEA